MAEHEALPPGRDGGKGGGKNMLWGPWLLGDASTGSGEGGTSSLPWAPASLLSALLQGWRRFGLHQ